MIPKRLHYIWVGGGTKSQKIQQCIASFGEFCPDYHTTEWNEDVFDDAYGIDNYPLIRKALDAHNWALATDVMRVVVLCKEGGIYLDTDILLIKNIDELLQYDFFIGYETRFWTNNAVLGGVPNNPLLVRYLEWHSHSQPLVDDANLYAVHLFNVLLRDVYNIKFDGKTIVTKDNIAIFAPEYFYPLNFSSLKLKKTVNTLMIHYYGNSWTNNKQRKLVKALRAVRKIMVGPLYKPFERMFANTMYKRSKKYLRDINSAEPHVSIVDIK